MDTGLEIVNKRSKMAFDSLVVDNQANKGVQVDKNNPVNTYMDLKGILQVDTTGVNAPILATYKTGIKGLAYNATDVQRWCAHVEHWNVIGGNKYIHAHIRHNGTAITGDLVLTFVLAYNYGHGRVGSSTPLTFTQTITSATIATKLPQYDTYIEDILIAQSGGGAGLFDSDLWLPDDDILIEMTVTTLPTITGGLTSRIFIPYCDVHLESTNVGTKNKAPNFYT